MKGAGWAAARCAGTALLPERRAAARAGLGCADPGPSGCDRCRKIGCFNKSKWGAGRGVMRTMATRNNRGRHPSGLQKGRGEVVGGGRQIGWLPS